MMLRWLILPLALFDSVFVEAYEWSTSLSSRDTNASSSASVFAAWYTGWHATDFPLSALSWKKYTHMTYAVAITTPDVTVLSLGDSDQMLLPKFVSTAHTNNVKASLSIGGWTGSRWFSSNVGSAQNRTAFVNTVTNVVKKYNLDGVDFDWEYPGRQGIGCNVVNSNDTNNFLSFLQELRSNSIGKNLVVSAAVYVTPFADSSGAPSTNVSAFSEVLDYIAIMNYDIKSKNSTGAGPSSPLDDSCAPSDAQFGSATSAVKAWTGAGMPANRIVLGVPAYGHSFDISPSAVLKNGSSSVISTYPAYDANGTRPGDRWDSDGGLDVCGVEQGPGGIYTYWGLIQEGYLNTDGSVPNGIEYRFDNCSQTPFVYNSTAQTYISFDNSQSFVAKGNFIHAEELKGFAMWEAGGDYKDILLDSIRNASVIGDPTVTKKVSSPSPSPSQASAAPSRYSQSPLQHLLFVIILAVLALFS